MNLYQRCLTCGLHSHRCLCSKLPSVSLKESIVVVQHARELAKPSNTGRLVHRMLKNSTLLSFGVKGKPFDARLLQQANTDYYVLYPGPGAVPLDKKILKQGHKKKTFVVLDGTWAQAARMSHRVPFVKDFSFVTFPKKIHTQWGVRQAAEPHRLCTLEAVVHWMEVLYGKKKALPLRRAFKQVRNRHFLTKRRPNPYISQLRQSQSAVV